MFDDGVVEAMPGGGGGGVGFGGEEGLLFLLLLLLERVWRWGRGGFLG